MDEEFSTLADFYRSRRCKDKAYMFYNGNNYGYEGFGYAELIEE